MARIVVLLSLLALVGCADRASSSMGDVAVGGNPVNGKHLVEQFECNRCHQPRMEVDGRNCLSCHAAIGSGRDGVIPGAPSRVQIEAWANTIQHYRQVPSLHATGKLLRKDWIAKFLFAPHDLRPRLSETMPRLEMTKAQATDIAAYLTAAESKEPFFSDQRIGDWTRPHPPLTAGDVATGASLYEDKSCNACHIYSGVGKPLEVTPDRLEARMLMLAVDLRHTRDRFQPQEIVPFLIAPRHHKVDAAMPNLALSYQEGRDLAAFVMAAPLEEKPLLAAVERLPLLERRVGFDEIDAALFSKTCVHCHDAPDLGVLGDGGPGNVGGFGFKPKGISFADYESVFAGYIDDRGERRSLFERTEDGTPLLLKSLLTRRSEEAGFHDEQYRGMPMSLPSLTPEVLQLVESWIAQGRPR